MSAPEKTEKLVVTCPNCTAVQVLTLNPETEKIDVTVESIPDDESNKPVGQAGFFETLLGREQS